ncbi:helix-turn-helix domain-containing protein [Aeromicrobium sp.]|uniref:helix-turn-helix domain-containing protein n=1 Tax=Aeromicrobium sp. TaxID=1871063 RepID=UPI0039E43E97
MFRMGWKQKDLAEAAHMTGASVSRKLKGLYDWTLPEVARLSGIFHVEVGELLGEIPPFEVWESRKRNTPGLLTEGVEGGDTRARRDSNPKPSDP